MKLQITIIACFLVCMAHGSDIIDSKFREWLNQGVAVNHQFKNQKLTYDDDELISACRHFLKSNFNELQSVSVDLELQHRNESPLGFHLSFAQLYNGVKIYGTEIKVNISPDFKIVNLVSKLAVTNKWPSFSWQTKSTENLQNVIIYDGVKANGGQLQLVFNQETQSHFELLIRDGAIFYSRELISHLGRSGPDSLAYAFVFNPDPIQSEETVYGGAYKNHNGQDNEALNTARKLVQVKVKYLSDSFWAENLYVKIVYPGFEAFVPANSRTDTFDFDRSNPFFEHMNALYHISQFKMFVDSLGYGTIVQKQTKVNTQAFDRDNSYFDRSTKVLNFGYGDENSQHVDDAEDADVIIHEFGHALSFNANGNQNASVARKSIDEGISDYFACSYSRNITDYEWEKLFNWDGHNEFGEGRYCNANKTMKNYSNNSVHANGEIISSAMMKVWEQLGRNATDQLLIGALYMFSDAMQFEDFAKMVIDTDSLLNGQANRDLLCKVFTDYGFIKQGDCILGVDKAKSIFVVDVDENRFRERGELVLTFSVKENISVMLFDITGKLLYKNVDFKSGAKIPLLNVNSGVYVLSMMSSKSQSSQKLVKE